MPTRELEAIVLRQYSLSEADRIIVLLTREHGTLRGVAQGAKKPRSKLGGCLEPLTHVRLQFYAKEGAELGRIWQCEIIHSYLGRNPTLEQIYGFSYLSELCQELAPENNPNPLLFRLLLAALAAGEQAGMTEALLRYFELWALRLNGWLPDYGYCSRCGKCVKDEGFYAWLEAGQGRCRACAEDRGIRIGSEASRLLQEIPGIPPLEFVSRNPPAAAVRELERLAQKLIEWHLEKRLKSYLTSREVLRGGR
jgi:DNA repair protein RecO (recombination protein O)